MKNLTFRLYLLAASPALPVFSLAAIATGQWQLVKTPFQRWKKAFDEGIM